LLLGLKKLGVILAKVAGGADVDISDVNKCIYLIWAKGKRDIRLLVRTRVLGAVVVIQFFMELPHRLKKSSQYTFTS
jgi:hypothetical protein